MIPAAAYEANAGTSVQALVAEHQELVRRIAWHPVSYTHLTLPTIYAV